jgi:hypothetical protein
MATASSPPLRLRVDATPAARRVAAALGGDFLPVQDLKFW